MFGGSLQRFPNLLAVFKGPSSKGREGRREEGKVNGGKGRGGGGGGIFGPPKNVAVMPVVHISMQWCSENFLVGGA